MPLTLSARSRATKSVGPPAGKATTRRTARVGKSCALALGAGPNSAATHARVPNHRNSRMPHPHAPPETAAQERLVCAGAISQGPRAVSRSLPPDKPPNRVRALFPPRFKANRSIAHARASARAHEPEKLVPGPDPDPAAVLGGP